MTIESRRQRLIELAESLPEVTVEPGGDDNDHLGLSVRDRRFGWYLEDHHDDGVIALTCKAPPGVNTELADADPDRFFIPSYTGPRGWIGVRLDLNEVDWDHIDHLLEDAYRLTAP
ncbi:MAG: MmcQ/YjbR family DNA-binding protein, partial [Acidimicrobiia bacterium]|nr:MmcQ/YjbR family DNA-binding protein [Acidimicrobiia bacterium]